MLRNIGTIQLQVLKYINYFKKISALLEASDLSVPVKGVPLFSVSLVKADLIIYPSITLNLSPIDSDSRNLSSILANLDFE